MSNINTDDHLDHTFEVDLATVKSRAVRGIAVITGRGFILNFISQISQFFLLAFMSPEEMGVFWIVSAAVFFLIFFSDIGLAGALIQKKEKPTELDLKTTFTVQQTLIVILLILLYFFSPKIIASYNLSKEGEYLLYALGVSLFLSSLKSIPSILLERQLEFAKFVIPDILESLVYSVSVVYFAWQGLGLRSFTYAVLLRGVVGVVTIYLIKPWLPGFAFSKKSLKNLFGFGIPYQLNTLISVFKDRGITLILGGVIGTSGIGYLGTAERISQIPLRQFMDSVTKVSFPAFARMQEAKSELESAVTRSITFITFLTYPSLIGFALIAPVIFEVIPKYQKWEPSLIPFYFMTINVFFAAVTTQLTNLLSAIGKIKTVSKLITMWAVLTLILVPSLGMTYGVNGAAAGYALVSSTSVIAIYVAKKHVNFSLTQSTLKPLLATSIMGIIVYTTRSMLTYNFTNLILLIFVGGASYIVSSYFILGPTLVEDAKKLTKQVFKK